MAAAVKRRMLVMENGSVHEGTGFGSMNDAVCELVFSTSMVGYQEIVTDPSYTAQTVVMTYPATMRSAVILLCVSEPPSIVFCESCGVPFASLIV